MTSTANKNMNQIIKQDLATFLSKRETLLMISFSGNLKNSLKNQNKKIMRPIVNLEKSEILFLVPEKNIYDGFLTSVSENSF